MKFELKKPVLFGSETIHSIELRKITVKDLRRMPLDIKTYDQILTLVGSLITSCSSVVLDQLTLEDVAPLINYTMQDFLALTTGGTTSGN